MKKTLLLTTFMAVLLGLSACNTNTSIKSDLGVSGAPDWVNEGTQAVDNDNGGLLHGVGMAPAMNDTSLQTSTADGRARAEISRILTTYIDSTLSDYSASVGDTASMSIERDIRSSTQLALSGATILGHWKDKKTGDIYSFAELRLDTMDRLIEKSAGLSDSFKRFYKQNSSANFERFIQSTPPRIAQ